MMRRRGAFSFLLILVMSFDSGALHSQRVNSSRSPCGSMSEEIEWPDIAACTPDLDMEQLYPVQIGDRYGFINTKGELIIPAILSFASSYRDGLTQVGTQDVQCFIDRRGRKRFRCSSLQYDQGTVAWPSDGLLAVPDDDELDFVNDEGQVVFSTASLPEGVRPTETTRFTDGLLPVESGDRLWTFARKDGSLLRSPQFLSVGEFSDGRAFVRTASGWYAIDTTGNLASERSFHDALYYQGGRAFVNSCTEMIDRGGNVVRRFGDSTRHRSEFDPGLCILTHYSEGVYAIDSRQPPGTAYIDSTGKLLMIIRGITGEVHDGLVRLRAEGPSGKIGYVALGRPGWAIAPRFDHAEDFDRGLAAVEESGRRGYISQTGAYVWRAPFMHQ